MFLREVSAISYEQVIEQPKHYKPESSKPRHLRPKNAKPVILRTIIVLELISVTLSCSYIYRLRCHNLEMRFFSQVNSAVVTSASGSMGSQANNTVKTFMESVAEEMYEYLWTTEDVKYRTGADESYSVAGNLDEDKMVRLTGIMHNGWNRIVVDDNEYYIPAGTLSDEIPDSLPIADGIKGEYQKYALSLLPDFGWDSSELEPLIYLWNRESGWNPSSHNRSSGAHGIPQALPGSKMASEGSDYYTNPEPQIRWGLKYIASRYGSPSAAWAHFQSSGWY